MTQGDVFAVSLTVLKKMTYPGHRQDTGGRYRCVITVSKNMPYPFISRVVVMSVARKNGL